MANNFRTAVPVTYARLEQQMKDALGDLSIIAGDVVGPSNASWQDVAGTAAVNLRVLADMIDRCRLGLNVETPVVFPSPAECLDTE